MKKWNLIVDVANCTNCNVCTLALQDEHVGNRFPGYAEEMPKHGHRWINIKRRERGTPPVTDVAYLPLMCQHCDNAPCIAAAPDAVSKRADGIVIIDPEKAIGRKELVDACPYGAVWWNEEKQLPQHWIFDAHLLDKGWNEPRCVTVCATNALEAICVDDTEMQTLIDKEGLETLNPGFGTKPRVHYKNLWRYSCNFIAGTVSGLKNGQLECLQGARIELISAGNVIASHQTDAYGDFKFDKLKPDTNRVKIIFDMKGYQPYSTELAVGEESINLGEIQLQLS